MPFSGRLNKGYGDILGPTEVRPAMGGGVREINVASSKAVRECASRGRNRGSSLRIIISSQFNQFFRAGCMKKAFPFEIVPQLQELVSRLKPLRATVIFAALGRTWNVPPLYDDWAAAVRKHFSDNGIPWVDGTASSARY